MRRRSLLVDETSCIRSVAEVAGATVGAAAPERVEVAVVLRAAGILGVAGVVGVAGAAGAASLVGVAASSVSSAASWKACSIYIYICAYIGKACSRQQVVGVVNT